MNKNGLIVISGPTAAGKTAVAVETAKKVNGVIVSADSMQIYKYMSIGTAKPTEQELDGIECRLIDFVEPDGEYNVFKFKEDAEREIDDILSSGRVPILCGGTGLYLSVLTSNTTLSSESKDEELRCELKEKAQRLGNKELHRQLREVDNISADKIHPNDTKRLIRALEIYITTGKPQSQWDAESAKEEGKYPLFRVLITCNDREVLYQRINRRVDEMMSQGLLEEARYIYDNYPHEKIAALGYPELFKYFDGNTSLEDGVSYIKQYSRNYAKRQLTWFRRGEYEKIYFTDETPVSIIADDLAAGYAVFQNGLL